MMAQHILTRPVFEALFEGYDFAGGNPVARALDSLRRDFGSSGWRTRPATWSAFTKACGCARGLDNSAARQRVLMELYERFFATALKKDADRLGIVYTPVEIVDFILASADRVLRDEFGRSLGEEGVHVLDPFTGTGIFLVRLLQSALIPDADLRRKYREELHANEIVLLAYYIAAIHIEEAFHGRLGGGDYEPFGGIVLTDTFNLHTERTGFPREWLPDNSARAERQQRLPIQVIVGNPPWSAGQRSSADDNPNVDYPELEARIAETYAERSTATNKNSLYDTYKMAIRWASDRIGERGAVAFVTNGSWIASNVDSGVRACLAEEFTSIHVVNLRGNQRTQGERSRQEGGKVFGQGSRAPVAISILVKNPEAAHEGCRILYRGVGNYLSREEKLAILREAGSIGGIDDWQAIVPDRHHDWIAQRDEAFRTLYPVGRREAGAENNRDAVFGAYGKGFQTVGDSYAYNLSRTACAANTRTMLEAYSNAMQVRTKRPERPVDDIVRNDKSGIVWHSGLKAKLEKWKNLTYSPAHIRTAAWRPFVQQFLYGDPELAHRPKIMPTMFPSPDTENRAICVNGVGSTNPFSVLIVDIIPDLEFISKGQCFPRYRYERRNVVQGELLGDSGGLTRVDNITDTALKAFRVLYADNTITKDAIFDYGYGILHAPAWRERFANDLAKELPHIPFAPDFRAFAEAGRALAALHLGYETCREYPLGGGRRAWRGSAGGGLPDRRTGDALRR